MTAAGRRLPAPERYDLAGSLGVLALGRDPSAHVSPDQLWWAVRTPDGAGTLHLQRAGSELTADAYGPGRAWLLEQADAIAGLRDELTGFTEVAARHPLVARLAREHAGLRLTRTGLVFAHLAQTILSQKVTGVEAKRSWAALVRRLGEPAPGPVDALPAGLLLPPDAATLAATPYWAFHPLGVEQRRAETIRRAAARASAIDATPDVAMATRRLTAIAGVGAWTAAEVVRLTFGDPDVVTVGDYHLPHVVTWALAGEARGDDTRMLDLLAPFTGHRGRVVRLLTAAGVHAPRYGPRAPLRSFARF